MDGVEFHMQKRFLPKLQDFVDIYFKERGGLKLPIAEGKKHRKHHIRCLLFWAVYHCFYSSEASKQHLNMTVTEDLRAKGYLVRETNQPNI